MSPVLQIRLPENVLAELREEAAKINIEPSTLARTLIMEGLAATRRSRPATTSARAVETDAPGELTIDPDQDFGA